MGKHVLVALTAAACIGGAVAPARADVIYSNLGPGSTWSDYSWPTRETESPEIQTFFIWWGTPFMPTASGTLTALELPFNYFPDASGSVVIDLRSSSGGLPGTVLESFSFDASSAQPTALYSFASQTQALLSGGTQYFVTFGTTGSDANLANWYGSSLPVSTIAQAGDRNGPWVEVSSTPLAFRVHAEPLAATPEPASLLLLGTGLAGLAGWRRSRRPNP